MNPSTSQKSGQNRDTIPPRSRKNSGGDLLYAPDQGTRDRFLLNNEFKVLIAHEIFGN